MLPRGKEMATNGVLGIWLQFWKVLTSEGSLGRPRKPDGRGVRFETEGRKQDLGRFFLSQMAEPLNRHRWLKAGILYREHRWRSRTAGLDTLNFGRP